MPNRTGPTLPPALGDPHDDAYQALIAKDTEVGPVAPPTAIYLELPTTPTGSQAVPGNLNVDPLSITIDGVTATFIDRVDQTETADRYWIKCSLPTDTGALYGEALVIFPENANSPQGDRVFTALQILVGP